MRVRACAATCPHPQRLSGTLAEYTLAVQHRIVRLARIRNAALAPLWRGNQGGLGGSLGPQGLGAFDDVLFVNDVAWRPEDAVHGGYKEK